MRRITLAFTVSIIICISSATLAYGYSALAPDPADCAKWSSAGGTGAVSPPGYTLPSYVQSGDEMNFNSACNDMVGSPFKSSGSSTTPCSSVKECAEIGLGNVSNDNTVSFEEIIRNVINVILSIIGIVSVIMIILGGVRYSTSQGESDKTKSARLTIQFAIIGLIVTILAFAIVNFVLGALID